MNKINQLLLMFSLLMNLAIEAGTFEGEIKFHTSEMLIKNGLLCQQIYQKIDQAQKEFEYVPEDVYKNDEYFYCIKDSSESCQCSFYFSNLSRGELSSFYTDGDYGKGSFIDFIMEKPIISNAKSGWNKNGINLDVKGKLAETLYKKLNEIPVDYTLKEKMQLGHKLGQSVSCFEKNESRMKPQFYCRIFVPVTQKKIGPEIPHNTVDQLF